MASKGKPIKLPPLIRNGYRQGHSPYYASIFSSSQKSHTQPKFSSSIASAYSFQTKSSGSAELAADQAAETLMQLCDQLKFTNICRYNRVRRANETVILCLVRRSVSERQSVQRQFDQLNSSQDLKTRLKESLGLEYAGIIDGLLQSPYCHVAMEFRQLVEDLDPFALVDRLLLLGRRSLRGISADYKKQFGISLIADVQQTFGDPRISRFLSALVRGLLWPAAFTPDAVAEAARAAETQETKLLEQASVLLVGLQKYGPDFAADLAEAHTATNPSKSLLQCVQASYNAAAHLLVRKLLAPIESEARVRELAGRLDRLSSGACASRELVHQLILLSESPRVLNAVNRQLLMMRGSTLRDLVTQRCSRDCADVLAALLPVVGLKKRLH